MRIDRFAIPLADVVKVARHGDSVDMSADVEHVVATSRQLLLRLIEQGRPIYGVTTGVGALARTPVPSEQACLLSQRIILSHACGVGAPLEDEQVRAIMVAAILNFTQGYSGVRPELVRTLMEMLNRHVTPLVPSQGGMGSLTHMAHVGLVMLGLGEARMQGRIMPGDEAMRAAGVPTLELVEKEGLSLVNGTPSKTGLGALIMHDAEALSRWADVAGAMSFEALRGTVKAFDDRVHKVRPHAGQIAVAAHLLRLLAGSEIAERYKDYRVQDALSLRAMPQVHGACRDVIERAHAVTTTEINSATDNPLLFEAEAGGVVLSACNAHGEPMALAFDQLCVALTELASISERRIDRMVNQHVSELPPFLVKDSGSNSGFMIPQYVAASLVSENKVLSHPAAADSIPTTSLQEDHWSMGTPAALKAARALRNAQKVIAIEILTAAQALEFHQPARFGAGTQFIYDRVRAVVPPWEDDRVFYPDLHKIIAAVEAGEWLAELEKNLR
jgi:histidine ammonia-lyase